MQLTKHFMKKELECPCCCRCEMDAGFMEKLEALRVKYGKAVLVNSGFRCQKHNDDKTVGGKKSSWHLKGLAADCRVVNAWDRWDFVYAAMQLGLTVVVYEGFIHVDGRPGEPLLLLGESKVD